MTVRWTLVDNENDATLVLDEVAYLIDQIGRVFPRISDDRREISSMAAPQSLKRQPRFSKTGMT
jgi:hypothetical protein